MKLDNLKEKVLAVLAETPQARDSDQYLTLCIWNRYYPECIKEIDGVKHIALTDVMKMPREDSIKRHRAFIQNEERLFLPTKLKVVRRRQQNELLWLDYYSKNPSN